MYALPPDIDRYVQDKIARGEFASREEFVVKAARLYRDIEDQYRQLKADVQVGIAEADAGETDEWDLENIKAELHEELGPDGQPR